MSTASSSAGRLTLVVLCVAQFMLTLDATVVTVALPTMQHELGIAPAELQWVSTAYTLAFGGFLMLSGRAGDLFGRRRLLLGGLAVFTFASVLCGISQQGWALFAARGLQGLAAAVVVPSALALLSTTFSGKERTSSMALWGAIASAGAISGYLIGGVFVDTIGWRWIFFVNVPVGVFVIVGVLKLFAADRPEERPKLDLLGASTLTGALVLLVYAVTSMGEHGFDPAVIVTLLVGVVLLAVFVVAERRQDAPLVRFGIFTNSNVVAGNLVNVANAATSMVIMFFSTLYLQEVLGLSPLLTGLAFAPVTVVIMLVAGRTGGLMTRFGARKLLFAGAVSGGAGILLLSRITADGNYWIDVFPGQMLVGLGAALTFAPSMVVATSGVDENEQGLASGLVSTSQQLGGALGLAVFATLAAARIGALGGDTDAQVSGYRFGFLCAVVLPVLSILATLLVRSEPEEAVEPDDARRHESVES